MLWHACNLTHHRRRQWRGANFLPSSFFSSYIIYFSFFFAHNFSIKLEGKLRRFHSRRIRSPSDESVLGKSVVARAFPSIGTFRSIENIWEEYMGFHCENTRSRKRKTIFSKLETRISKRLSDWIGFWILLYNTRLLCIFTFLLVNRLKKKKKNAVAN